MKSLLLLFLITGCSIGQKSNMTKARVPAAEYQTHEQFLESFATEILDKYTQEKYTMDIAKAPDGIQFTINYQESDYLNVYGMGGIRKRNLHILLNEMYISLQEKTAKSNSQDFQIEEAKRVYLRFRQE